MVMYSAASWRTLGAALPHNLLTISNATGSGVTVRMRRMTVQLEATAALTSQMPQVKMTRTTALPSGGTAIAKTPFDGNSTSAGGVVVLGATASDGGAASAVTATATGGVYWQQYAWRPHTVVGQFLCLDNAMIPALCEDPALEPLILQPSNQAFLVQIVGGTNPATNHWLVNLAWDEVV